MSGIVNSTGAVSGVIGTTVGTPAAGGITEADMWRVTVNWTGDATPIASNWERVDNDNAVAAGVLGTGMSESSGIFTFPSTGYWLITAQANSGYNGDSAYNTMAIWVTENNSAYAIAARGGTLCQATNSSTGYGHGSCEHIMKLEDTTNEKVRFQVDCHNEGPTILTASNCSLTYCKFIKLADV